MATYGNDLGTHVNNEEPYEDANDFAKGFGHILKL